MIRETDRNFIRMIGHGGFSSLEQKYARVTTGKEVYLQSSLSKKILKL